MKKGQSMKYRIQLAAKDKRYTRVGRAEEGKRGRKVQKSKAALWLYEISEQFPVFLFSLPHNDKNAPSYIPSLNYHLKPFPKRTGRKRRVCEE